MIVGGAGNLTDSLSVHAFVEAEHIEAHQSCMAMSINFLTRLLVAASFVSFVVVLPARLVVPVTICWGFALLSVLTYLLAKAREVQPLLEIFKHLLIQSEERLVVNQRIKARAWQVPL